MFFHHHNPPPFPTTTPSASATRKAERENKRPARMSFRRQASCPHIRKSSSVSSVLPFSPTTPPSPTPSSPRSTTSTVSAATTGSRRRSSRGSELAYDPLALHPAFVAPPPPLAERRIIHANHLAVASKSNNVNVNTSSNNSSINHNKTWPTKTATMPPQGSYFIYDSDEDEDEDEDDDGDNEEAQEATDDVEDECSHLDAPRRTWAADVVVPQRISEMPRSDCTPRHTIHTSTPASHAVQPLDYFCLKPVKRPQLLRSHWSSSTFGSCNANEQDEDDEDDEACTTPTPPPSPPVVDDSGKYHQMRNISWPKHASLDVANSGSVPPPHALPVSSSVPRRPDMKSMDSVEQFIKRGGWKRRGIVFQPEEILSQ